MIDIRVDFSAWTKAAAELNGLDVRTAASRALNRAGDMATTQLGRVIAGQAGMGVREVRDQIQTKPSKPDDLVYTITVPNTPLPLSKFDPRQETTGVSAAPWGLRRTFAGTFFLTNRGERVFKRRAGLTKQLWGPLLGHEVLRGNAKDVVEQTVREVFPRRMNHEFNRLPGDD